MIGRFWPVKGGACGLLAAALMAVTFPAAADEGWWRCYGEVEFDDEQTFDGDSFHLKVKSGSRAYDWVIRLYGVDCPETDDRFAERNAEQAKHFGIGEKEVETWGKKAARQVRDWLRRAKEIRLHVRRSGKEKTKRSRGQEQRYYGVVELIDRDGESAVLHELLLEAGLARAYGMAAPWPPKDAERLGEQKAEERFVRDLERLEHKAKKDEKGIWGG